MEKNNVNLEIAINPKMSLVTCTDEKLLNIMKSLTISECIYLKDLIKGEDYGSWNYESFMADEDFQGHEDDMPENYMLFKL